MTPQEIADQLIQQYQLDPARVERALWIVESKGVISTKDNPQTYRVVSQTKGHNTEYLVDLKSKKCGCPDHQRTTVICKHIIACLIYAEIQSQEAEKELSLDESIALATTPAPQLNWKSMESLDDYLSRIRVRQIA